MKINANKIRPGNILSHKSKQWVVLNINILQPGKGSALIHAEMRDLTTGTKVKETWRTQESVERLRVDEHQCRLLFRNDNTLTFMDEESYDQHEIDISLMSEGERFLQDDMVVTLSFIESRVVSVALPPTVILKVQETEPVVKGQTASSSYKPAILINGLRTPVPPHIGIGDRIVVNTADGSYVERAKSGA